MARNATVPLTGRIQKRKTNHLRIVIFGLQRAAGPYRWATSRLVHRSKNSIIRSISIMLQKAENAAGKRLDIVFQKLIRCPSFRPQGVLLAVIARIVIGCRQDAGPE